MLPVYGENVFCFPRKTICVCRAVGETGELIMLRLLYPWQYAEFPGAFSII